ncbi:MAG: CPBP family intramembrane metalloprotease [Chloroflexi bacterium]|nr:CPBP family intramembrane metalloprotease [Chloroflexota bacterium]
MAERKPVIAPLALRPLQPWQRLPRVPLAAGLLLAVGAAEACIAFGSPPLGLAMHVTILLWLLWHGARSDQDDVRGMLFALMTVPVIRICSLCLPLGQFPAVSWPAIVMAPVMVSAFTAARTAGYSRQELGLTFDWPNVWWQTPLLVLLGVAFGAVEYAVLQPTPDATSLAWGDIWPPILILSVATGFGEEFVFRGLLQHATLWRFGPLNSMLLVTALFTCLHIGYRSAPDLVLVFAAGMLFSVLTWRSGSLAGAVITHAAVNVSLFLLTPLLFAPLL